MSRFSYLTHLECSESGATAPSDRLQTFSEDGFPFLARYDLKALSEEVDRDRWSARRPSGFWNYHELLPVQDPANVVSLGETQTPLIEISTVLEKIPGRFGKLYVKDEGRLPTHSFKARGMAAAVSKARELGVTHCAVPSAGNAGAALSAYAARAGLTSVVVCPNDTHETILNEIRQYGAELITIDGLIQDCGKYIRERAGEHGWFDFSTLKEPYRIEGKKTIAFELAVQLDWKPPSVIFYPTGGGTGLIAIWKAYHELKELGWIDGPLPRMIAVQAAGCAPIVKAWEDGDIKAGPWPDATTRALGLRVPAAFGDRLILRGVRESDGFAIAVSDEELSAAKTELARETGLLCCLEGAATYAAFKVAVERSMISEADTVVCFNSGSGLKDDA